MSGARRSACAILLVLALAGCGGQQQRQPVIPRAAYTDRTTHREAVEGRDTTWARLTYPDFLGARTPEALDSLRAAVQARLLAPAGRRKTPAGSMAALMDGFISDWSEQRAATGSRAYWSLERHIEVLAETLGVVSLAATEVVHTGGAHPNATVRLINVHADRGRTLRFADLFPEELRDSLSAALEPLFREARGIPADSSLKSMGFTFERDRFRAGDNLAITSGGVWWHFDPYEIAPYAWGPTDIVAPFELVQPFAQPGGPLGSARRQAR